MKLRGLLIAACTSVVLVALTGPAAGRVSRRSATSSLAITGFQRDWDPTTTIDRSAASLTTVVVDGVNLTAHGNSITAPTSSDTAQLVRTHHDHLRAELLVGNWSSAINDFSEPVAHTMLASAPNRAAVVSKLAAAVHSGGWNGVSVDLESLLSRDTAGLSAFVTALRTALPTADTISVNIQNESTASDFSAAGYNLTALGKSASRLILMGYDENGPWESTPGPIGQLSWQKTGLTIVLRSVAAAKVDLGVAGYGYAWRPKTVDTLTDAQSRALVHANGATAKYNTTIGEWTAKLSDGSVLWWSDARSLAARVTLATSMHLHGLAVWSLGQSDPITA